MPRWFLILNGIALLTMGMVLLPMRLRERPLYRQLFGIAWALLCCAVGAGLLAMAQGYIELPGQPASLPSGPATKSGTGSKAGRGGFRGPEFPSGR